MTNIEDKVIARKKAEEKREKQFKNHGERLREINDSLRKKNLRIIGVPENTERVGGPESIFKQNIAENFPNLRRKTSIQNQEIERYPSKSIKTVQHSNI